MTLTSQIIITQDFEETISTLRRLANSGESFVEIVEENFKVEHANLAIEKAYLASSETNIIILGGNFSPIVQNRLLKILEEPPKNKEFILLVKSKSTLLPTIKSRLPISTIDSDIESLDIELDITRLDLKTTYEFIHKNSRLDTQKAKYIVEHIVKEAIISLRYDLDDKTLELFRDSILALDKGSPPSFVLTALLLKLLARKKRG